MRDYLIAQLSILDLEAQVQDAPGVGTRYPEAGRVQNILARMAGTQSGGPAVLLVAHYDSVEAGPGAADDSAGIAAILETIRALPAGGPGSPWSSATADAFAAASQCSFSQWRVCMRPDQSMKPTAPW